MPLNNKKCIVLHLLITTIIEKFKKKLTKLESWSVNTSVVIAWCDLLEILGFGCEKTYL